MNDNFLRSRRLFLENSLKSAAFLSLAGSSSIREALAVGEATGEKRYLVNCMVWGGIDTHWWWNAVPSGWIADITRVRSNPQTLVHPEAGAIVTGTVENPAFISPTDICQPFRYWRNAQGVAMPINNVWDIRFPNSAARSLSAVSGRSGSPNDTIGPGLQLFGRNELEQMCFVTGMTANGGGHYVGNRFMQTGQSGTSASSFSSIVAEHLARSYVRPLHYVQVANNPGELYNQAGPLTGPAMPINIPNQATWAAITSLSSADLSGQTFSGLDRRQALAQSLERLKDVSLGRLQRNSSKSMYSSFYNSFRNAQNLSETSAATSPAFTAMVEAYRSAMNAAVSSSTTHSFKSWFPDQFRAQYLNATIQGLAFQFGLAEYLIVNDLSAVIDLPTAGLDYHSYTGGEASVVSMIMTSFQTFVQRLRATQIGITGQSFLDRTTIVLHTEFDRSPALYTESPTESVAGSSHWEATTSAIFAGCGVAGGRKVGGFTAGRGPASTSPFKNFAGAPQTCFLPLPVNQTTGYPDPNGVGIAADRIYPTILSLFGCSEKTQVSGGPSPIPGIAYSGGGSSGGGGQGA